MAIVKKVRPPEASKPKKKVGSASSSDFALATERSEPSDNLLDYSFLLFGAKKIGKTTLASMFPDAYFLACEPGTKALSVFETPIPNWRTFKQAVRALRKDRRFRFTIVDTVDIAYKHCETYVCDQLGIDHISEADWGKGWAAVRTEFENEMRLLMSIEGKGTMLISHAVEREIKKRSGEKYDRIQPTMANIARDICEAMVDVWAHYDYDGDRRVLTIRGDDHITAGHRLQTRFRWEGREVVHIDMGTSKEEAYNNLIAAFNNAYQIPDAPIEEAPEPAKKKLVKKVKR